MKTYAYLVTGGERGETMEVLHITEQEIIEDYGYIFANIAELDPQKFIRYWVEKYDAWEVQ